MMYSDSFCRMLFIEVWDVWQNIKNEHCHPPIIARSPSSANSSLHYIHISLSYVWGWGRELEESPQGKFNEILLGNLKGFHL